MSPSRARMRWRALLAVFLLAAPASAWAQEPVSPTLGTHGLPGLVVTPTAGALPVGRFYMGANVLPDFEAFWTRPTFTLGRQYNGFLAFNVFSRVTVGVRVTDRHPQEPRPLFRARGRGGSLDFPLHHVDLSPSVQVLLAGEGRILPALAVGAYDITGTGLQEARYVVASKRFGPAVQLSAGYGRGPLLLDGAFGGAEVRPTDWVSVRGEWDGTRVNAGLGLRPRLAGAAGRWVSNPEIQALWARGEGWYWGVSLGLPWDGDAQGGPATGSAQAPSWSEAGPTWASSSELLERLADLGLEDVGVAVSDSLVEVRYEDRVHLQNAMDGFMEVLARVAAQGRPDPLAAEVTLVSSGRPVLAASASGAALRALREGDPASAGVGIRFRYPEPDAGATLWRSQAGQGAATRGRADLVLRPTVATHLAWEKGLADARFGLLPTLEVPLFAGLNGVFGYNLPLWQSEGMVVSQGPLPGGSVGVAVLSYMWNRTLAPGSALAVHWSGGRLNGTRNGVRQQAALFLRDGQLRLDADVAATRGVGGTFRSLLAVGGARWLFPDGDTRLSVSAGHYLYRDVGVTAELSRYFGDTQVAFSIRHSDNGSQGVFAVTLPLVRARSRAPGRVRPRLPAVWTHGQNSTLFTGSGNWIAFNIAEGIRSPMEVWDRFYDRDRLSPVAAELALRRELFRGRAGR